MIKLKTSGGIKILLSEEEYKRHVLEKGRDVTFQENWEVIKVGSLKLLVRWPDNWYTPGSNERQMALVTSEQKLGSYIGLSKGLDGYHLGVAFKGDSPIKKELEKLLQEEGKNGSRSN